MNSEFGIPPTPPVFPTLHNVGWEPVPRRCLAPTMSMSSSSLLRAWHPHGKSLRRKAPPSKYRRVPLFALSGFDRSSYWAVEADNAKGGNRCSVALPNLETNQCEGWLLMLSGVDDLAQDDRAVTYAIKHDQSQGCFSD